MIASKAIRLAMPGKGLHNCMGYTREPMTQHDKINYLLENTYHDISSEIKFYSMNEYFRLKGQILLFICYKANYS